MDREKESVIDGRMQAISVMDAGMAVWEEGIGASLTKGGRRTDLVTKVPLWGKRVIIPSLFNSLRALDTVMRLTPVSYTHLDVYKRQMWHPVNGWKDRS